MDYKKKPVQKSKKGFGRKQQVSAYDDILLDIGKDPQEATAKPKQSPLVGVPMSEFHAPEIPKKDVWEKRATDEVIRHGEGLRAKGKGATLSRIAGDVDDKKKVRSVYKSSGLQQLKSRKRIQNHSARVKAYLVSNVDIDPNLLFHMT